MTGLFPGEVQGNYQVEFRVPRRRERVRITGYSADRSQATRNFAQQTNAGPIRRVVRSGGYIYHRADTMGGNSGSSVISESTGKIIGIHTHGGCGMSSRSGNVATLLAANVKAKKAIRNCLKWESENL